MITLPNSIGYERRDKDSENAQRLHRRPRASAARAVRAAIVPLLFCDDVAFPALKPDPDTEIARVVPADVEVRQRAVLRDAECICDDRFQGIKMLRVDCH
jgi:hypothetical protein